jgi:hypothetical protein
MSEQGSGAAQILILGGGFGGHAVKAEGSFFALPHPVMGKEAPSAGQFADKLAWVAQHLAPRR